MMLLGASQGIPVHYYLPADTLYRRRDVQACRRAVPAGRDLEKGR